MGHVDVRMYQANFSYFNYTRGCTLGKELEKKLKKKNQKQRRYLKVNNIYYFINEPPYLSPKVV